MSINSQPAGEEETVDFDWRCPKYPGNATFNMLSNTIIFLSMTILTFRYQDTKFIVFIHLFTYLFIYVIALIGTNPYGIQHHIHDMENTVKKHYYMK